MTKRTWDAATVARELQVLAADADQLTVRLNRIYLLAEPEIKRRLEKVEEFEIHVNDFIFAVPKFVATLKTDGLLEYPNGGSHRTLHLDGAS